MSMRPLDFELLAGRARSGWASWVLAALALAFVADLGRSWHALRGEIAWREATLALRTKAPRDAQLLKVTSHPVREGEIAAARDTIRRLSVPWDSLFSALEWAQTEGVSLLSIEPDVQSSTVTITGEAKDYLALLSYLANLKKPKTLTRVHLAKHDMQQKAPQRPISFVVLASWKEGP